MLLVEWQEEQTLQSWPITTVSMHGVLAEQLAITVLCMCFRSNSVNKHRPSITVSTQFEQLNQGEGLQSLSEAFRLESTNIYFLLDIGNSSLTK